MMPRFKKQQIIIFTWTCLWLGIFITPVFAVKFLPFLPNRTIRPDQYSQREDSINDYNKQAIELFEDGQFQAAQELWEKAIEVMEDTSRSADEQYKPKDMFDPTDDDFVLPKKSMKVNDIDEMYDEAVSLFRKQRYVASKKMFERVESRIPDHKATRNYLTILELKIKQTQQSLSTDKIQENIYSRQVERDEWRRILEESEKELEKKIIEQVEPLYEEALKHYKKRKFALAKDYFQEIDSIRPNYKDTSKYLIRVDVDIKDERQRIVKEEHKKKVLARKQEHEEWQRIIKESEQKLEGKMKEQAEPVYQEALFYYKQREFELAKSRFQEVEMIVPGYKSVTKYIERIEQDIQKDILRRQEKEARELARKHKMEEAQQKREEQRMARLRAQEEKLRLKEFKEEVAARRLERREWLKVLDDGEKERLSKLKDQADFVYRQALDFYKKRRFKQAKEDFLEVEQILPDYKSTSKYLVRIDNDIEEEDRQELVKQQRLLKRQMREVHFNEIKQQEKEQSMRAIEDARRIHEFKEKTAARKQKRDEWDRVLKQNEIERDKRLKKEADFIYNDALAAYKNKDWDRARSGFIEAEEILPGYKKTEKYIARIERDVELESIRIQKEIADTNEAMRRKEELARKAEEERQLKLQYADMKRQEEYTKTQADIAFRFAVSLYERQKYVQARGKFQEVQELVPGYKSTERYLARSDSDIQTAHDLERKDRELASRREMRDQQFAKQKDIEKAMKAQEKKRLKELKAQAKVRKVERDEWERSMAKIEKENKKRLEWQADSIYKEALRYYEAGWYIQARESFQEVESSTPGYRSTRKYLAKVEQKIKQQARDSRKNEQLIEDQLADDAIISQREQLKAESWRRELVKDERRRLQADKQRDKSITDNTEIKYREALDSYKAKRFIEAKLKFIEVDSFSPGYRATLDYLKRIEEKIEGQREGLAYEQRAVAVSGKRTAKTMEQPINERRYNIIGQALAFQERGQQQQVVQVAQAPDQKIIRKAQKYDYNDWEKDIRKRRKALKNQRRQVNKEFDKQFRQLYDRAVKLYRKGSYGQAKKLFLQIDRIRQGYKKATSYIKKSNLKIAKGIERQVDTEVARTKRETQRNNVVGAALDGFE